MLSVLEIQTLQKNSSMKSGKHFFKLILQLYDN